MFLCSHGTLAMELPSVYSAIFFSVLLSLIYGLMKFYQQCHLLDGLPGPPVDNAILGHVMEMIVSREDLPRLLRSRFKKYGDLYKLRILGFPFLFIASAEYAEVFFTAKHLQVKSEVYRFLHCWLGLGLLTNQGEIWQQRRKLITPAFHFSILNALNDIFVDNALSLMKTLREYEDGTTVDVSSIMHLVTLDIICESAMGIKIDALKNQNLGYIKAIEDAGKIVTKRMRQPWHWIDPIFFLLSDGQKLTKDLETIFDLTNAAIKKKRSERSRKKKNSYEFTTKTFEGKTKLAFLDLLLEACESDSIPFSEKDLRDEVNTFLFEGQTTAVSMSFTLYLLGLHPEIQEKCHQELESIFQGSDRKPTGNDLRNMNYLEQVIKEGLRLFPSVPILSRQVNETIQLGDYTIAKGSIVNLNVYNLHRNPKYFPEPDKFDPDRFSTSNYIGRHPFAFVPFSAGPRSCIGQKFAMMAEKVVLSYILRNFTLESVHGMGKLKILFDLVTRPKSSLDVIFKRRKVGSMSSES